MNYIIQHLRHMTKCVTLEDGSTEFSAENEISYVASPESGKYSHKPFHSSKYLSKAKLYGSVDAAVADAKRFIRFGGMDPNDVKIMQVERTIRFLNDNMNEATTVQVKVDPASKIYDVGKTLLYKYGNFRAKDGDVFWTIRIQREGYEPWYVVSGTDIRDDFFQYNGHVLNAIKFSSMEMATEAMNFYMTESDGRFFKSQKRYNYKLSVVSVVTDTLVAGPRFVSGAAMILDGVYVAEKEFFLTTLVGEPHRFDPGEYFAIQLTDVMIHGGSRSVCVITPMFNIAENLAVSDANYYVSQEEVDKLIADKCIEWVSKLPTVDPYGSDGGSTPQPYCGHVTNFA